MINLEDSTDRWLGFLNSPQITLGDLIALLEVCDPSDAVRYDFEWAVPTTLASWRGIYRELALGYTIDSTPPTVASLLEQLRGAMGCTFTGWKGGEFVMDQYTPLWVANPGLSGSTVITGIRQTKGEVILRTAICAPYLSWQKEN